MAVILKTVGEQLMEVQTAISGVMTSQKYEYDGRMVTRADLDQLTAREKYLTDQLANFGDVVVGHNTARGAYHVNFM
ncbi:MAG: hypothetical protein DRG30_04350 [Epsilonproteobacteria bacterium]|nr:MAG: hypothetical protein DRG30_04350 [Campylobacterota bacterium]